MGTADPEGRLAKGKEAKKPNQKQRRPKEERQNGPGWNGYPCGIRPSDERIVWGKPLQKFVLNFELDFFIIFNCLFIDGASTRLSEGSNIW